MSAICLLFQIANDAQERAIGSEFPMSERSDRIIKMMVKDDDKLNGILERVRQLAPGTNHLHKSDRPDLVSSRQPTDETASSYVAVVNPL